MKYVASMRLLFVAALVCLSCGTPVVTPDGGAAGGGTSMGGGVASAAGGAAGGSAAGGSAAGGSAAGGSAAGGSAAGGSAAGGSAGGGSTAGGSAGGGSAAGGSAAGGSAAGGSAAGGSAGGAANVCAPLESAYLVAVESAKRCPLNALVNPCSATRPNVITCGCPTYIDPNNAAPVDALQTQYTDAGCVPMACPRCAPLDAGFCEPYDAGVIGEGRCVDRR